MCECSYPSIFRIVRESAAEIVKRLVGFAELQVEQAHRGEHLRILGRVSVTEQKHAQKHKLKCSVLVALEV